jgi:hypothetical protein
MFNDDYVPFGGIRILCEARSFIIQRVIVARASSDAHRIGREPVQHAQRGGRSFLCGSFSSHRTNMSLCFYVFGNAPIFGVLVRPIIYYNKQTLKHTPKYRCNSPIWGFSPLHAAQEPREAALVFLLRPILCNQLERLFPPLSPWVQQRHHPITARPLPHAIRRPRVVGIRSLSSVQSLGRVKREGSTTRAKRGGMPGP